MAERWSALWRRGTNFMDKILKGGVFYPNPTVHIFPRFAFLCQISCGKIFGIKKEMVKSCKSWKSHLEIVENHFESCGNHI